MATVYVQSKGGKPLMPTQRCGHVRILLKHGRAKVVRRKPFTIRLTYETPDIVQDLYGGTDPGRTNIGNAVVDEEGKSLYRDVVETRNKDIPALMQERRQHRQASRRESYRRYNDPNRVMPGAVIRFNGITGVLIGQQNNGYYYMMDRMPGVRLKASECRILLHNKGLVYM